MKVTDKKISTNEIPSEIHIKFLIILMLGFLFFGQKKEMEFLKKVNKKKGFR